MGCMCGKKRALAFAAAVLLSAAALWAMTGCTDAGRSKLLGYGSQFQVTLYACDGSVIREWTSSGKVRSEESSDGYYFMDKDSGRLIEVTGTLIIEKLD